jgi:hypothetical protein
MEWLKILWEMSLTLFYMTITWLGLILYISVIGCGVMWILTALFKLNGKSRGK